MDRRTLLAGLAAVAAGRTALAQSHYPDQPIRWVVPYPAGGGTDVLARTLAEALRQPLGQQLVIDNRPGASTNIGAQLVATAKPDGYTVMSADNAVLAFNEHLFSKLPFNPEKDFSYIGGISRFPWPWW
jgi:tripartite-type tricarboxylate transporter receptor subunit TctC